MRKQILIENAGVNFDPSDEIYLEPDRGTKLSMELGPYGSIAKITVVQKGCGFTRVPKVRINTRTGFNQELIPLFEVQRIGGFDLENLALRILTETTEELYLLLIVLIIDIRDQIHLDLVLIVVITKKVNLTLL